MMIRHFAVAICILLVSSSFAVPPKNVILLIGDGMGPEQVKAAGMYAHGAAGTLSFESLPYQAQCMTYSANNSITDSAAAATAIATGQKVNNDVISVALPGDGHELFTMLEYFKAKGKSTGLVTTVYVSHATPAGFGAHETSRNNFTNIANDYLTQTKPNVLMGGALYVTSPAATAAGYTVVTDRTTMQALNTNLITYLSGQFGSGEMPYEYDGLGSLPHLSEMTATALDILDNDMDGFFLMIEGGKIDKAGHANDLPRNIAETIEFSNAVQVALDWAAGRTDTLVIVTADHETGGLTVVANNGQGVYPTVTWSTTGHTGVNVPVYATGAKANRISGTMNNTDFFNICISPSIGISAPADGATVYHGQAITLTGAANGIPPFTYTWQSDVDGYLGSGSSIVVSDLSVHKVGGGVQPHTITLTVEDANLDTNTAQIQLTILYKADFEPDGDVDLEDFGVIAANWLAEATALSPGAGWWKFNETSGTAAADSTANGYTGTLVNMDNSDWVMGKYDNALDFDGVNDYVEIVGYKGIAGTSSRTCMAWIKTPGTGQNSVILSWGGLQWIFGLFGTGELTVYAGGPYIKTTKLVNDNEWHHVAATMEDDGSPDVSEIKLYIDGALQPTVYSPGAINTSQDNDVLIGGVFSSAGTPSAFFDGSIDDVRIYDYAVLEPLNIADFDKDGFVNLSDLMELVQDWLASGI